MTGRVYEFGPFRLDECARVLLRDGEHVAITPKVFDTLLFLISNAGRTVTREELLQAIWPNTFVEEGNLNYNMSQLRKILGEQQVGVPFVHTVPKVGYRFVAEIRQFNQGPPSEGLAAASSNSRSPQTPRLVLIGALASLLIAAFAGTLIVWLRPRVTPASPRPVPLTSYAGWQLNPSFSPDGNQVAFSWDGEHQDNFDIYVKLVGPGAPIRLTTDPEPDVSPVWSPDGRSIAFVRELSGRRNAIFLIPALGGAERKLTQTQPLLDMGQDPAFGSSGFQYTRQLAWSPDGQSLVYSDSGSGDGVGSLFLISVSTGERRQLTSPPKELFGDSCPAFSPDAGSLAFCRLGSRTVSDLYQLPLSSSLSPNGAPKRLTFDHQWNANPAWSRNGLLFIHGPNGDGGRSVWKLASGNRRAELAGIGGDNVTELTVGRHLGLTKSTSHASIWRVDLKGQQARPDNLPRVFISSALGDRKAKYSPDGSRIAFISERSGSSELWVCAADGSNPIQLTSFGGPLTGYHDWSPDGQQIVFHARPQGKAQIFTVPANGGMPRRLTQTPDDNFSPTYSRDGRFVYFCSRRGGAAEVWKMPSWGGEARQVTTRGGGLGMESWDGKVLYYSKSLQSGIWRMPVNGGEEQQVVHSLAEATTFTVIRNGLYYISDPHRSGRLEIMFLDFSTTRIKRLCEIDKHVDMGLTVTPDNRYLLYTQMERPGSYLMLLEDFK